MTPLHGPTIKPWNLLKIAGNPELIRHLAGVQPPQFDQQAIRQDREARLRLPDDIQCFPFVHLHGVVRCFPRALKTRKIGEFTRALFREKLSRPSASNGSTKARRGPTCRERPITCDGLQRFASTRLGTDKFHRHDQTLFLASKTFLAAGLFGNVHPVSPSFYGARRSQSVVDDQSPRRTHSKSLDRGKRITV